MSFVKNVDTIVQAIGAQYPGIVYNLASVKWDSDQDRDTFLRALVSRMGQ